MVLAVARLGARTRSLDHTHSPVLHVTRVHCGLPMQEDTEVQTPAMHTVPPAHTCPQEPQLFMSVSRVASQPFAAFPSQLPKVELQVKPQVPALHVVVALVLAGQTFPQAPQAAVLVFRFASQPFAPLPSQSS